jgi:hypothetical protein
VHDPAPVARDSVSGTKVPKNPTASYNTHVNEQERKKHVNEQEWKTPDNSTHLTPAEAGRLLGSSPARVREMLRRGELTQEWVDGRWLIPVGQVNQILNPSSESGDYEQRTASRYQRSKPTKKRHEGKLPESTSSTPPSISKAPVSKKIRDLAAEIGRLDTRMKQIDGELRDLRSGLMNDEKREGIEKLKTEKRKHGKKLQKLRTELSEAE